METPKIIPPTIGRKVWFWDKRSNPEGMQAEDATVVYVHNDRLVNLFVVDHSGNPRAERSVLLRQPGDELNDNNGYRYACWMPFQVGQAATVKP